MLFLLDSEEVVKYELARIGLEFIQSKSAITKNDYGAEKYNKEFKVFVTRDGRVFKRKENYEFEFTHNVCSLGYHRVHITRPNGKRGIIGIHRLVALAFIDNPESKPDVNHIDGDKSNNKVENLQWVTKSENILHSVHNLELRKPGRPRKDQVFH